MELSNVSEYCRRQSKSRVLLPLAIQVQMFANQVQIRQISLVAPSEEASLSNSSRKIFALRQRKI
jgi:hypothetical protein